MTARALLFAITLTALMQVPVFASGSVGIYALIEKVVFEPSNSPQRVRVYGAFAFLDSRSGGFGDVQKGYLYFQLPPDEAQKRAARLEWLDLSGVAGTGKAVAFGRWNYSGAFSDNDLKYLLTQGRSGELTVRKDGDPPGVPVLYLLNTGIVRLPDEGNLASLVKQLRSALQR
jgi:hypothetical protein